MGKATPPRIVKLSAAKQRRLDELLDKNSAGTIAPAEKAKLVKLVTEAELLMVANANRLAQFTELSADCTIRCSVAQLK